MLAPSLMVLSQTMRTFRPMTHRTDLLKAMGGASAILIRKGS